MGFWEAQRNSKEYTKRNDIRSQVNVYGHLKLHVLVPKYTVFIPGMFCLLKQNTIQNICPDKYQQSSPNGI